MFYRQRRGWAGADHDLSQLGIRFDVDMRKFKEEISEGKLEALLQDGQKEGIQRHVYRHFLHNSCGNQDVHSSPCLAHPK